MKAKELLTQLAETKLAERRLHVKAQGLTNQIMDLPDFQADPFAFGIEYVDLITVREMPQTIKDYRWWMVQEMGLSTSDLAACVGRLRYDPEQLESASKIEIIDSASWAKDWGIIDLPAGIATKHGLRPEITYQLAQKRSTK